MLRTTGDETTAMGPRRPARALRFALVVAVVLALAWVGYRAYRSLGALSWWAPPVDWGALDRRVRADLPPGTPEAAVLPWLRGNGFADERIRLIVYTRAGGGLAGRTTAIVGWIPQRQTLGRTGRVTVNCAMTDAGTVRQCAAYQGGSTPELATNGLLAVATPQPAR